jgi:hypothetical protein
LVTFLLGYFWLLKFLETLLSNDWLVLQARKRKKTLVYTKGRDGNPSTRNTRQVKAQKHM